MATTSDEILVAEHDQAVAELIRRYLTREGLRVRVAATAAETAAELAGCRAAVVLLDLTMPGLDAREIRRMIHSRPVPPTSPSAPAGGGAPAEGGVLAGGGAPAGPSPVTDRPPAGRHGRSRHRGQPTVRGAGQATEVPVICLFAGEGLRPRDIGVDPGACVPRPFGPRTLVDRVRAAARSVRPRPDEPSHTAGRLTVHPASRRSTVDGAELALTGTEFDVLACLMRSAGRAVPRATLRAAVWGEESGGGSGDRIVDVYIAQLRTKIGRNHGIRTVRGIGYVLDETAHDGTLNPGGRSGAQKPPATIGDAGHPTRGDSGTA